MAGSLGGEGGSSRLPSSSETFSLSRLSMEFIVLLERPARGLLRPTQLRLPKMMLPPSDLDFRWPGMKGFCDPLATLLAGERLTPRFDSDKKSSFVTPGTRTG